MAKFASGKYAFAICDRCGDKIKYKDLKTEWTGFRVCKTCLDHKTKQEFPGRHTADPEALKYPRPNIDKEAGNGTVFTMDYGNGQTPIGTSIPTYRDDTNQSQISVGQVTVVIT